MLKTAVYSDPLPLSERSKRKKPGGTLWRPFRFGTPGWCLCLKSTGLTRSHGHDLPWYAGAKHGRSPVSATYRIEFMNGGERVKTVDLDGEPLEEAIEVAQAGMEEYGANFARIVDTDGVEVWNGRNDAFAALGSPPWAGRCPAGPHNSRRPRTPAHLAMRRGHRALAVFIASCLDHAEKLAAGEVGMVLVLAASRQQAAVVYNYARGFLEGSPILSALIETITADSGPLLVIRWRSDTRSGWTRLAPAGEAQDDVGAVAFIHRPSCPRPSAAPPPIGGLFMINEAGALQIPDKPLCDDRCHELAGVIDALPPLEAQGERERLGEVFGGCWREGVAVFGHFRKIAERQNKERTLAQFLTNLRCGLVGSEPDINRVSQ